MSAPTIDPIFDQNAGVDPKTGQLTGSAWWFLFQLHQATTGASQNSFLNTGELFPSGGVAVPDLASSGPLGSFQLTLNASAVTVENPIFTGANIPAGAQINIFVDEDGTGGRPAPTFQTGAGGFSPDLNTLAIVEDANTRTIYGLCFDGVIWNLRSFATGETL